MSDLSTQKRKLRQEMLSLRQTLPLEPLNISLFLDTPELMQARSIAAYWPMKGELDIRPLFLALEAQGKDCALPVVIEKDAPLVFRRWKAGEELVEGKYGTQHPKNGGLMVPDLLLVPLLAFDTHGGRLGFGGGYYDRTLCQMTAVRVGMAFDEQQVDRVPMDGYDQKMDWIVTPTRVIRCQ